MWCWTQKRMELWSQGLHWNQLFCGYSAWIRALEPWGICQATGKVTRRHQGEVGRWQKLSARARCLEPGSIQSRMWNVEIVTREIWLILLNEVSLLVSTMHLFPRNIKIFFYLALSPPLTALNIQVTFFIWSKSLLL